MTPEIEPRRAVNVEAEVEVARARAERDLAHLASLIDRADAEASRLRARRLQLWHRARDAGLSWREIARASGVDHASVQKKVGRKETD